MSSYETLEAVIAHRDFPDVDNALRSGRHVDREDVTWFELLRESLTLLAPFYERYQFDLVEGDGYFFLLPQRGKLARRHLSRAEMLVGQSLALLRLDPTTLRDAGVVTRARVMEKLQATIGDERLIVALLDKRRRSARVAENAAREEVRKALDGLARLGFVEVNEDSVRLRDAVMRFAEPVRGAHPIDEALTELMRTGRVASLVEEIDAAKEEEEV